jgi:hypothetical protein
VTAQGVFDELKARGVRVEPRPNGNLYLVPRDRLTPDLVEAVRQHKPELLGLLVARHCERTGEDLAGYLDRNPSLRALLERPALQGWTPAHSVVATCQCYGITLRIDPDGTLVVGKAGAKADEPTQPRRTLLIAIDAHADAVARLVEAGWHLRTDFPCYPIA